MRNPDGLGGIPQSTVSRERSRRSDPQSRDLPRDGRYIDPSAGALEGEAAGLQSRQVEPDDGTRFFAGIPSREGYDPEDPTYFDLPVLKEPVWIWLVPVYFHLGGLAGATGVLGGALNALGGGRFERLARRCHQVSLAGTSLGTACLVLDLGRPSRFLYMLRVFRPTSPMNMGTWILAASGTASVGSLALERVAPTLARLLGIASAPLGALEATYPAVLLNCTAVEAWRETRATLPVHFAGASMASAGALLAFADLDDDEKAMLRGLAGLGLAVALGAGLALEAEARSVEPRVGRPYSEGVSGALWKASRLLTAAGLGMSLLPARGGWKDVATAALATAGSLAGRFAAWQAGRSSSRDARASFHRQRRERGAGEELRAPSPRPGP